VQRFGSVTCRDKALFGTKRHVPGVGKTCVTLQKAPFRNAKSTISRPDMHHIALRNGAYRMMKECFSQNI